jgi:hypothetical protein
MRPSHAVLTTALIAGLLGCAPRLELGAAPPTVNPRAARPGTSPEPAPYRPTVQLRYFWFSPEVTVVAWDPAESGFGLRSALRRDGSVVRDHSVFVSSYLDPGMPAALKAEVDSEVLLLTGTSRDLFRCSFGDCSPAMYFGARISDDALRSRYPDPVSVRFQGREGRELVVTLQPELVAAYLATVDSVSALLRGRR